MRQNIYTDPQKPIQMEPKVYEVGEVTDKSPVLITTNFSLTYFSVEGEVEASRIPAYILAVDTEGQSVLTAYAAEKFTAEDTAAAMRKFELDKLVSHKKVIIPGFVAVMSGALQEESGWEVLVGPREATGIPAFLRTWKA
jgi:acetyl-CoA decarbonylase/synthase complex subunit gamma